MGTDRLRRRSVRVVLVWSVLAAVSIPAISTAQIVEPVAAASESSGLCDGCAVVVSVKSETRVAGKGLGATVGNTLNNGVLGDQPDRGGINDTLTNPPGTTSAGLVIPRADRAMVDKTAWAVTVRFKDGSTRRVAASEEPSLRPGDVVRIDDGKLKKVN